jgi:hypothetical protein
LKHEYKRPALNTLARYLSPNAVVCPLCRLVERSRRVKAATEISVFPAQSPIHPVFERRFKSMDPGMGRRVRPMKKHKWSIFPRHASPSIVPELPS